MTDDRGGSLPSVAGLPVAVLGLGSIGGRMAARLLAAGADLSVWNRSPGRAEPLAADGARVAPSPAAAGEGAQIAVLALTDDAAVRAVVTGEGGLLQAERPPKLVVDTSTTHPDTARELAQACSDRGVHFIDSPLTGGAAKAEDGTLTLMCGGDETAVDEARRVLAHLATKVLYMGPSGAGQTTKAVNQVILAGSLLGVSEGVAMAEAAGLDVESVLAALQDGAAASWVLSSRGSWMARRDFPPAGRLALHHKDLRIALDLARSVDQRLPGAELVAAMEGDLIEAGRGDDDVSALVTHLRPDAPGDQENPCAST